MEYQNENFGGDYQFRCRFHNGWIVKDNLHEYSELLYCEFGEGEVFINDQKIHLKEKQLVLIPPNYIHRYNFPTAKVICAVFSNDFIPLFFEALAGRYYCVSPVNVAELSEILEKFHLLKNENHLTISGYLNLICAKIIENAKFDVAKRQDGILYQKVISYLSEHYTENITLSQIAKNFGYNKKYLSHVLYGLTGIHFRQLLAFYRINHAKRLLMDKNDINIMTVAQSCGYTAINTFNRTFKNITGMTPTKFKIRFKK